MTLATLLSDANSPITCKHTMQADSANCVIRLMIMATGAVSTLAGNSTVGYANGIGTSGVMFNVPTFVAMDAAGAFAFIVSVLIQQRDG